MIGLWLGWWRRWWWENWGHDIVWLFVFNRFNPIPNRLLPQGSQYTSSSAFKCLLILKIYFYSYHPMTTSIDNFKHQSWPWSVLYGSGQSQVVPVHHFNRCHVWFVYNVTKTGWSSSLYSPWVVNIQILMSCHNNKKWYINFCFQVFLWIPKIDLYHDSQGQSSIDNFKQSNLAFVNAVRFLPLSDSSN